MTRGAPVGAGTDLGSDSLPGFDLHREIRLLEGAGLTPAEALHTATRGPGPRAGGDPLQGRLVAGAPADLVLLREDAFASTKALGSIEAVMLRGELLDRARLDQVLAAGRDDCDGLELLGYSMLRRLGFPTQQLFRAVVRREHTAQHHMVTLWFEDEDDPWVIDPTGAMTTGMPRMSEVPSWVPIIPLAILAAEWRAGFDADAVDTVEAARRIDAPLLAIVDGLDPRMPEPVVRRIVDAHPGPNRLWVAEDVGHVGAIRNPDWEETVFRFLGPHQN